MADFRPISSDELDRFLGGLRGKAHLIEPLSTTDRMTRLSPAMDSLGFFEEDSRSGKWDLLDTCTHLFLYDDDLVDRISMYSNMTLISRVRPKVLKFLTVTVVQDPDEWIIVIADMQRFWRKTGRWPNSRTRPFNSMFYSPYEIAMEGSRAWKCDQVRGLMGLLSSPEFRSMVSEWHGNYKVD